MWQTWFCGARFLATRLRDYGIRLTGYVPTYKLRTVLYRWLFRMKIERGVKIEGGCQFFGPSRITIGEGSVVNYGVVLDGRFPLTIGKHVSISLHTIVLTLEHDLADPAFTSVGAPVSIGARAFIGARAIILPGVNIGEGAGAD